MEAGRSKDAATIFEVLEGMATDNGLPGWREAVAISSLTTANYPRAITIWNDQLRETASTQIPSALYSLPFLTLNPLWAPDSYPMTNIGATAQLMRGVRLEGAMLLYNIAQAQMEAGEIKEAANSIRQALKVYPSSAIRPVLRFYLEALTGEQIEAAPPASSIEELADLSESEPNPTSPDKPEAK
jgi:tetratricopeptide (TPR) repeat protein